MAELLQRAVRQIVEKEGENAEAIFAFWMNPNLAHAVLVTPDEVFPTEDAVYNKACEILQDIPIFASRLLDVKSIRLQRMSPPPPSDLEPIVVGRMPVHVSTKVH